MCVCSAGAIASIILLLCLYLPTHLFRLLMKCQVSGGQREEVGRSVTSALQLARKHAPNELIPLYKQAVSILLYCVYCVYCVCVYYCTVCIVYTVCVYTTVLCVCVFV